MCRSALRPGAPQEGHHQEDAGKTAKALQAKTPQGRANHLFDALAEEGFRDPVLDSLLHMVNEVGFAQGPIDRKLQTWIKKTLKYALQ